MTEPLRVPGTGDGTTNRLLQYVIKRRHAEAVFETHPTVDLIIFDADFPQGRESVTVRREEMNMPVPRDFEGWRNEVEAP